MKKIFAADGERSIAASFKSEREYEDFCGLVMNECIDEVMKSLSLEELISLWRDRNESDR